MVTTHARSACAKRSAAYRRPRRRRKGGKQAGAAKRVPPIRWCRRTTRHEQSATAGSSCVKVMDAASLRGETPPPARRGACAGCGKAAEEGAGGDGAGGGLKQTSTARGRVGRPACGAEDVSASSTVDAVHSPQARRRGRQRGDDRADPGVFPLGVRSRMNCAGPSRGRGSRAKCVSWCGVESIVRSATSLSNLPLPGTGACRGVAAGLARGDRGCSVLVSGTPRRSARVLCRLTSH